MGDMQRGDLMTNDKACSGRGVVKRGFAYWLESKRGNLRLYNSDDEELQIVMSYIRWFQKHLSVFFAALYSEKIIIQNFISRYCCDGFAWWFLWIFSQEIVIHYISILTDRSDGFDKANL
jgi:hypothetical protein